MSSAELRVQPPVRPATAPDGDEEDVSLERMISTFVGTVRRRWRLVAAVAVSVALPTAAYAVTSVPTYTSHGAVQVSEGGGLLGGNPLSEIMGGGVQAEVQTEVEIIRRREFLADAMRSLGLQVVDRAQATRFTLDIDVIRGSKSPVDQRLRQVRRAITHAAVGNHTFTTLELSLTSPARGRVRVDLGTPDAPEIHEFAVGELLELPELRLQFRDDPLPPGESMELAVLPEGELLKSYEDRLSVSSLGTVREPTNIVQVSVTDTDRDTARALVQAMMDRYLARTLEWQSQSASQAADFIEGQLDEVRENLTLAEEDLKNFAQENNAVHLETQAKVAIENAAELEVQRVTVELQEKTIGSVLTRIEGGRASRASLTANFFEDPVLAAAVGALTEAETKVETMAAEFTTAHPLVEQARRGVELQRAEVGRLLRSAQKNLAHQKKQLAEQIAAATEAMSSYPDTQLALGRLTRDMEVSQRLYTLLLEKHEEAEILKASTTTDKRVVDAAGVPHEKTAPRRGRLAGFGLLGGLLLGMGAAFLAHLLQRRLETVEAVREVAALPIYGTVPEVAGMLGRRELSVSALWAAPHEPAPEAFRALGVGVTLLPASRAGGRVLLVTSSQPGEGKSTVAANLAMSIARTDKRVLLVDLDLRKPVQHRIWGVARAPGYSDLVGQAGSATDVTRIGHGGAESQPTVLTAGTRMPDTVAAILSPALERLVNDWASLYDYVVIDSPPAFVAETSALARFADLVMLVVRPGVIERANLRHALEALDRLPVARGLVLNAVSRRHTEYYYGSGYYYYGAKYGEDDAKSERAAS